MIHRAGTASSNREARTKRVRLHRCAWLLLAIEFAAVPVSAASKHVPQPVVTFPGGVVWQYSFESPPAQAPAFDGRRAFVVLRNGTIVAVDHASGALVWTATVPATVTPLSTGQLVVGADGSHAWALDAATGRTRWRQDIPGKAALGAVADAAGALFLTDAGDAVMLALEDGRRLWTRSLGGPPRSLAALGRGAAWAGLEDGRVMAIDLAGGAIRWTRKLAAAALVITPLAERVLVGSADHFLYALKAENGSVAWRWRTGGTVEGTAAADAKRVYFVSRDATLRALDRRHGDMRWQRPLSTRAVGGPLLAGDVLIVAGVSPELRGFRTGDGGPTGVVTVPGWALHGPVLAAPAGSVPARVLLLTAGGQLLAIGQTVEPPIVPLESLPGKRLSPEVLPVIR